MLELGGHTVRLHEDVGRQLARMGVDVLLTVGGTPARGDGGGGRRRGPGAGNTSVTSPESEEAAEARGRHCAAR